MAVENELVMEITRAADKTMAAAQEWKRRALAAEARVAELGTEVARLNAGWHEANGKVLEVGMERTQLKARVLELQELDIQLRDRVVIAERDVRRLRQSIDGASEFDLLKARQSAGTACDEFRNQDARKLAALLRDACDRIAHLELDQSGEAESIDKSADV